MLGQQVRDVDLVAGDPAAERVLGVGRGALQLVHPLHLLLGRVRDERVGEHAAEQRIGARPSRADHREERRLVLRVVTWPCRRRHAAVEHHPGDPLGVRVRRRPARPGATRHPEHSEPIQPGGLDQGLEVRQPAFEREVLDVPVGQPEAPLVVPHDGGDVTEVVQEVPPHRALPVVLKVAEPARHDQQRRTGAVPRPSQPDAVVGSAEPDLLVAARLDAHGERLLRRAGRRPRLTGTSGTPAREP